MIIHEAFYSGPLGKYVKSGVKSGRYTCSPFESDVSMTSVVLQTTWAYVLSAHIYQIMRATHIELLNESSTHIYNYIVIISTISNCFFL